MRYLFLSPPAMGEMRPTLAIAAALLDEDLDGTVYIASGSSFERSFTRYKQSLDNNNGDAVAAGRIFRLDLGQSDDVEDYSKHLLKPDASKNPRLFGSHRHARGNPIPFFNYWQACAAGSEEQRLATIQHILQSIDKIRPDMIIVDQIYGTPYDGKSTLIHHESLNDNKGHLPSTAALPALSTSPHEQKLTLLFIFSFFCPATFQSSIPTNRLALQPFAIPNYHLRLWHPAIQALQQAGLLLFSASTL